MLPLGSYHSSPLLSPSLHEMFPCFLKRSLVFPIPLFFLYFFALIPEESFVISLCYSLIFCMELCLSFLFFSPLLLLPAVFPSIRVFSNESVLGIRWPKYWSFSSTISLSNDYSGLISFRMDWFDLLAVQGILKSLLQHHNSKASIFWCSAFFTIQLSHLYMTTGKTIALTRGTFVVKVMSLLFNMLSRFVIDFLPRSKRLLIFMAAVTICSDFGAPENKV